VVEVFAALKPRWPEASLTIIGEGPLEAELRQSVARHQLRDVTFLGWMDQRRLFDELCQAEVFLFLSVGEWERLPNVVKEAMAAHCVCVVARAVAIEELVQPDRHGFVVNLADRQAAVDAVTAVFQDPVLRESLVQRSLSHLNSSFDVRQSMKKYIEVWQRRLAERSGAAAPARAPADRTNAAER
jgi:glycosyltransferase involved in cell wall biosynthesis